MAAKLISTCLVGRSLCGPDQRSAWALLRQDRRSTGFIYFIDGAGRQNLFIDDPAVPYPANKAGIATHRNHNETLLSPLHLRSDTAFWRLRH